MKLFPLAILAALIALALACSNESKPTAAPSATGEPAFSVPRDPDNGAEHILPTERGSGYSVKPATSGQHWLSPATPAGVPAPANWGIYRFELPDEVLVHNMEHGGIGIHYDCPDGCAGLQAQLEEIVPSNPSQLIVSPYSGMETKIAITAWRRHLFLDEFDAEKISQFIATYKDKAPESVQGNMFQ
jgi:hypothetical protein